MTWQAIIRRDLDINWGTCWGKELVGPTWFRLVPGEPIVLLKSNPNSDGMLRARLVQRNIEFWVWPASIEVDTQTKSKE
jgi:hypothetical protein